MPRIPARLAFAAFCLAASAASAQTIDMSRQFRQSAAVLARYPDLPVELDTPSLAPGRTSLTSQEEMEEFLRGLKARNPKLFLGEAGRSQQGRAIPYLVFTAEGLADLAAIRSLGRPIVWFIGQQHGDEPAGGEAMLAVAKALAEGEFAEHLARVTVVVLPRANPDGAAARQRATASKVDLNRDHILLTLPESRAIHARIAGLPPDVIVDFHEFSVANRWIEKFGGLQASDAMILYATHPLVRPEITALAQSLFMPAIEAVFARYGLTSFLYHTTSTRDDDKLVSMGGNAPGIARNTFGLLNAISFLVETRGVGVGMEAWQRRVATHYLLAGAVLGAAAREADRIRADLGAARTRAAQARDPLVLAHELAVKPVSLPLVDPATGATKMVEVPFQDSRVVTPKTTRARPAGYLIDRQAAAALEILALNRIAYCILGAEQEIEIESYRVSSTGKKVNRESINPDQAVAVALVKRRLAVPAGTIYVPSAQPGAGMAIVALEPDSPGSLIGTGIIEMPAGSDIAPVHRSLAPPAGLTPGTPKSAESCRS